MKLTTLLIAIEVGGTLAFATSGLIEAMRKRMDVVGVFSVAFVSAFGGGTVRDLLLDRRPFFLVEHEAYLWLVFAMVISAPWWLKAVLQDTDARLMEIADAFGPRLFAISGTSIAVAAGMSPGVSVLMGTTTANPAGVITRLSLRFGRGIALCPRGSYRCRFVGDHGGVSAGAQCSDGVVGATTRVSRRVAHLADELALFAWATCARRTCCHQ